MSKRHIHVGLTDADEKTGPSIEAELEQNKSALGIDPG
jgi:hypothetical protein